MCSSVCVPALGATRTEKRPLLLGQSVPLTGQAEQIGFGYYTGAKLYFDVVNARGGVAGRRIDVRFLDDGYSPATAAANARKFVDAGVDALFGFVGTASSEAAYAATKASGTLFFAPFAAPDSFRDPRHDNVFMVRPGLADEAYKIARHCATLGQDRVALFAEDDAMGYAGLQAVRQALVDLKRPALLGHAFAPPNSEHVDGAVNALLRLNPQAIIQVSLYNSAAAFIRRMRQAGYGGQFLTFSVVGIGPLFMKLDKEIGGIIISQTVPYPRNVGIPLIKEYVTALDRTDQTPSYESVEGYVAARAFVEGVRRAGTRVERDTLQSAFESITNWDVGGHTVNLRAKKYEQLRSIDLVTMRPDGTIVR